MVDVRGLRRRYEGSGRSRTGHGFEAVRGVDIRVRRGELYALLGTNGAGKTSTVETVEGLAAPSGGTVRVLGRDPFRDRDAVRPRIGIMLQEAGFPGALTVAEMAALWHRTLPSPRSVAEVLDLVVLGHRRDVAIASLSGGERRRLDLALALMGRPDVLFLDEPTTGLDPQSRRATWELIGTLLRERTTVLLTTHYLEEAEALADRIAIMHAGVIAREGTLAEIVSRQPTRITFAVDAAEAADSLEAVRRMAGAGFSAERQDGRHHVRLETFDPQPLLRLLLDWAGDRLLLRELRVTPGSLEQAFLDVAAQPPVSASQGWAA
ncbi:ABC transporter ATP-binding protein [Microlunatus ginsengisoli]|uniref:ABC transporter ATP-binding protein n=1 Tax=Microlunatus ginsengisoli TaxID=363863 RepID=A0ABP7ABQ0_9ACTN